MKNFESEEKSQTNPDNLYNNNVHNGIEISNKIYFQSQKPENSEIPLNNYNNIYNHKNKLFDYQQNQKLVILNECKESYPISNGNYFNSSKNIIENGISNGNTVVNNVPEEISLLIRMGFIRKVYGIVLSQLLMTFFITCFSFIENVRNFFILYNWIIFIGLFFLLIVFFILGFKKNLAKKVPINYILLVTFTISVSIILLNICAYYNTEKVLIAWSGTIVMSFTIIIMSFFLKVKFKIIYGLIMITLGALLFFGILSLFTLVIYKTNSYLIYGIYCTIGAILYGLYLVIHTQMLVDNKLDIDPDQYIFASLQIYLDVVMIFIYLLSSKK